jgi:hypothetical protein
MVAARSITIILLIMAILMAYSPQICEQAIHVWETIRPAAVQLLDVFYSVIRSMLVGDGSNDQIEHPPADPGVNFDRIVT